LRRIELADQNWRFRGTSPGPGAYARLVHDGVLVTGTIELTVSSPDRPARPIGLVAAYGADQRNGHCYASTIVDRSFQRTGLGLEALYLLLDHLFISFPLRKVYFETIELHLGSWRSAATSFLELEGRFREHEYIAGAYRDRLVFSLRREQWPEIRAAYLSPVSRARDDVGGGGPTKAAGNTAPNDSAREDA
jgi:RimJ/RimL family protein N-acetyltransferase